MFREFVWIRKVPRRRWGECFWTGWAHIGVRVNFAVASFCASFLVRNMVYYTVQ